MRAVDFIQHKRDGKEHSAQHIREWIEQYCKGEIPDYQMSSWLMAVYFNGMSAIEVAALTMAMAESGDQVDLSAIEGIKVDKHSTGGVGDKTSLIIAPIVAAVGVPVAKMSGRGLGHTGGTIDKLESIQGFHTELTQKQFVEQVNSIGVSLIGQSGDLAPADKQLYALRDVTATVESIPLISSSIMSKKIAAGADAIVLDVKTGNGAFMKTLEDSIKLAEAMVTIGSEVGRDTAAIISDMDQPLGYAIGNALEVAEVIDTLKGKGPADLTELSLTLAAHLVLLGKKAQDEKEARELVEAVLHNGQALEKLKQLIAAQGGDATVVDYPDRLPQARSTYHVVSEQQGYVAAIEAEALGLAAMKLGAGRQTKDDRIDHAVGIVLGKKVGEYAEKGDVLATLHVNSETNEEHEAVRIIKAAFHITEQRSEARPLLQAIVTKHGVQHLLS
ncbi:MULTISPECIES: pyrimidine-nucleoside phosphorylase [Paenibacillus]|uniref:pyrimidine-nucleoside phosphorylase n=1 Tax=Paenibacillus TaxID=44249 RepID=UPI00203EB6DD|nr:pyrimidine-nucleoside phosphorylase [Paenibacillus camelliae]MCM3633126.1 pyrimidine-nucleoside phosphorylase [Paenibacillus camelliae]